MQTGESWRQTGPESCLFTIRSSSSSSICTASDIVRRHVDPTDRCLSSRSLSVRRNRANAATIVENAALAKKLKDGKAPCDDGYPTKLLKQLAFVISSPLPLIFLAIVV